MQNCSISFFFWSRLSEEWIDTASEEELEIKVSILFEIPLPEKVFPVYVDWQQPRRRKYQAYLTDILMRVSRFLHLSVLSETCSVESDLCPFSTIRRNEC